ncbi:MAG: hypothetical protein AUH43_04675 [Acidobacteria bacterium 13_1_40CM_65_14]|nr:MAG: hypothetical protein AUH43_04675 [Acidobacteria bacterium 13_1_40CM_65_14]
MIMRRPMLKGLLVVLAVAIVAVIAWAVWSRVRSDRAGLPGTTVADRHPTSPAARPAQPAAATPRTGVTIDPRRQQLIGVRTVAAKRAEMTELVRTVGVVQYDETRVTDVNLKVEGWIRELYVDYTGQLVTRGQPLFTLYSPDLLATEHEYLLALKTRDQMQSSQIADARVRADTIVAAARQRLALWDLSADQLQALEQTRQPQAAVTFRSPAGGYVTEKQVLKGAHVTAGQSLYRIADLSVVWIEADVYENDVSLVRLGQHATVTLDAYPGERYAGRVVYIYPYVNQQTRTNKVRYEFANGRGRFKPGMYANVELSVSAGAGVTVPANAVLDSGKEQIVFVAQGDGYFEPRRVKVGRRLGADVQIVDGIKTGEQVATGATFFLDSESQLRASLQGYEAAPAPAPAAGPRQQLDITLRSQPDPPKAGENQFEATVKDSAGKPIDDAQVTVQFFMAAMPTMNMPAMRSEVKLLPVGGGVYRGTGNVMIAGRWDVTVSVARNGQRLGSKQMTVVAR